ncbi:uncharacterized protein [Procambarus clarkii]|uniref:uncharacterized protein n=1 Tax=Procambarus clarkii TaxID=6728 RepID=UPI00374247C0
MISEQIKSTSIETTSGKKKSICNQNDLVSNMPLNKKQDEIRIGGSLVTKEKKWRWRKNKKRKREEQTSNENCDGTQMETNQPVDRKLNEHLESLPPAKKKKRKKKKNPGVTEGLKPVLIVKTPEDYSANWKRLKEIIAKDSQKLTEAKGNSAKSNIPDKKSTGCNKIGTVEKCRKTPKNSNSVIDRQHKQAEKRKKGKMEVWFDNVDPILLEQSEEESEVKDCKGKGGTKAGGPEVSSDSAGHDAPLTKTTSFVGVTKVIGMDCEMVGVGMNGEDSILARVSIVNHFGKVLYDKYVKPTEEVIDYRTHVSGIRPSDIKEGAEFSTVQKEVSDLLTGRILVGHALRNDLKVLFLSHPRADTRDTSRYKGFRKLFGGRTPSLKNLTEKVMGVQIQHGEHNSVQDAQAAMRLYTMHRREWEEFISKKRRKLTAKKKSKPSTAVTKSDSDAVTKSDSDAVTKSDSDAVTKSDSDSEE